MSRTGRIRWHEKLRRAGIAPQVSPPSPLVIWRCPKRHLLLRVFKYRNPDEFRVVGESFKAPLPEYLERIDSPYTAEEVRGEDIAAMVRVRPDDDAPPPEVIGMNEPMPLDTSASEWRADVAAEVGCRCSVTTVPIALLRDDVQHAETTRKPVRRTIT